MGVSGVVMTPTSRMNPASAAMTLRKITDENGLVDDVGH